MDIAIIAATPGITSGVAVGFMFVAYQEGVFCRAKRDLLHLWKKLRAPFLKRWKWNPQLKRFVEFDFEKFHWYLRHPEAITKDTYQKALKAVELWRIARDKGNQWYLRDKPSENSFFWRINSAWYREKANDVTDALGYFGMYSFRDKRTGKPIQLNDPNCHPMAEEAEKPKTPIPLAPMPHQQERIHEMMHRLRERYSLDVLYPRHPALNPEESALWREIQEKLPPVRITVSTPYGPENKFAELMKESKKDAE